jgi:tetratricopeptide (TPR) repeat protein
MKYYPIKTLVGMVLVLLVLSVFAAQAQNPQEILKQYISDLQKNPNDYALREKIIKLAQEMKPAPAIPQEAEKFEGRAEFAFKNAKSEADFLDAAKEYEKALLIAPWASAYYFNQGLAYEKAGKFKEAKRSFEFYLLSAPNAQDARDVRKRIAGLEYAIEKATKESSPEAIAAKKENAYETWLKSLDGARFIGAPTPWGAIGHENEPTYVVYYINGQKVSWGRFYGEPANFKTSPITQMKFNDDRWSQDIRGKQFTEPVPPFLNDQRPCTGTISDDGQFITVFCPSSRVPQTYTRVR